MDNFKIFVNKRLGSAIDFDGYYSAQCTDFVRQYCLEMFGETYNPSGNAGTLFYQDWGKDYEKHENTPDFLPKEGDICIWSGPNKYGHIGIVIKATLTKMRIIDQNSGDGSGDGEGDNAIRIHVYNYNHVIGFIRNKNFIPENEEKMENKKEIAQFGEKITKSGFTFPKSVYGIPVRLAYTKSKTLVGKAKIKWYLPGCKKDEILIFSNTFRKGENFLYKMLMHEFSHFVYHRYIKKEYFEKINKNDFKLTKLEYWEKISTTINDYITNYASTQPAEDFAELIGYSYYIENDLELPDKVNFNDNVKFKYIIAYNLYKRGLKQFLEA